MFAMSPEAPFLKGLSYAFRSRVCSLDLALARDSDLKQD